MSKVSITPRTKKGAEAEEQLRVRNDQSPMFSQDSLGVGGEAVEVFSSDHKTTQQKAIRSIMQKRMPLLALLPEMGGSMNELSDFEQFVRDRYSDLLRETQKSEPSAANSAGQELAMLHQIISWFDLGTLEE